MIEYIGSRSKILGAAFLLIKKHNVVYICVKIRSMPTISKKTTTTTAAKKAVSKRPKKGSLEAIMKAAAEARKNGLDLSFLKP